MRLLKRLLAWALVLTLCLGLTVTAFAAPGSKNDKNPNANDNASTNNGKGHGSGNDKKDPDKHGDSVLTLLEDESTVLPGTFLRASTYAMMPAAQAEERAVANLAYFGATLYDYDTDIINAVIHQMEVDAALANGGLSTLTKWNGLYFNGGDPGPERFSYAGQGSQAVTGATWTQVANGGYYADEALKNPVARKDVVDYTYRQANNVTANSIISKNQTAWQTTGYYYLDSASGEYYPLLATRSGKGNNITFTWGYRTPSGDKEIKSQTGNTNIQINISIYNRTSSTAYVLLDSHGVELARGNGTNVGVILYQKAAGGNTNALPYAAWNFWKKGQADNRYGQYIYSGLVQDRLDANSNPVFNITQPGLFTTDQVAGKDIYYNVDMPFAYNSDSREYTFSPATNGAYFKQDANQNSTVATPNDPTATNWLYFDENKPQGWTGMSYGDGSKNLWAPFNTTVSGEATTNYHFGMQLVVPFTMTGDGTIKTAYNETKPIQFHFSGDDDVWVFIDGKLVLDIGGIHNRLDGDLDFFNNTAVISESNASADKLGNVGDSAWNPTGDTITRKLFNEGGETGLLGTDLATFASQESHQLIIFYLERGKGASNCEIKFNLPMKDYVTVTKHVAGVAKVEDGKIVTGALDTLTEAQQAVVKNQDFGFVLYKKTADGEGFVPVANAFYSLLDAQGNFIRLLKTDENGHFTLKDGQSARFTGEFDNTPDKTQYFVTEDVRNGYILTKFDVSAKTAYTEFANVTNTVEYFRYVDGHYFTDMTANLASGTATVEGSNEASDTLEFVCSNYVNASLPDPTAMPEDDRIVIDYGLPVVVDPMANDYYLADFVDGLTFANAVVDGVYQGEFGTFTYDAENHKLVYRLHKQLTGVEEIHYTLTVYSEASDGTRVENKAEAVIYIIPASIMYYEQDFSDMVTYRETDGWKQVGTSETDCQEPGVVGDFAHNSPYGADQAYRHDGGDSNGSSMYVSTAGGPAQFAYSFTSTGTAFFARTCATAGYMRVVIYDADGKAIYEWFRDNRFVDSAEFPGNPVLYNIPVFTYNAPAYGTYTVKVDIAKRSAMLDNGTDFWLDGIRVFDPMNVCSESSALSGSRGIAQQAYRADGEAFMKNAALREKLLQDYTVDENGEIVWNGNDFVLLTDTNGAMITAAEYKAIGPKEEVYLYSGQTITFSLANWDENCKVFLGIKAPFGSGKLTVSGKEMEIDNAADYYYDLSTGGYYTVTEIDGVKYATFTIKAGAGSLIALTNIKVTGKADFTIIGNPAVVPDADMDIEVAGYEGGDEGWNDPSV